MTKTRRVFALWMALTLGHTGLAQAGGLIKAEEVLEREATVLRTDSSRTQLLALLSRDDVSAALVERGVTVEQAQARVASLTDAEAAQLLANIDRAPAGAGELIGTVVLVGVLLVFTDILGYTRIFPFIRPAP